MNTAISLAASLRPSKNCGKGRVKSLPFWSISMTSLFQRFDGVVNPDQVLDHDWFEVRYALAALTLGWSVTAILFHRHHRGEITVVLAERVDALLQRQRHLLISVFGSKTTTAFSRDKNEALGLRLPRSAYFEGSLSVRSLYWITPLFGLKLNLTLLCLISFERFGDWEFVAFATCNLLVWM